MNHDMDFNLRRYENALIDHKNAMERIITDRENDAKRIKKIYYITVLEGGAIIGLLIDVIALGLGG